MGRGWGEYHAIFDISGVGSFCIPPHDCLGNHKTDSKCQNQSKLILNYNGYPINHLSKFENHAIIENAPKHTHSAQLLMNVMA